MVEEQTEKVWHYRIGSEQKGPFTEQEMKTFFENGFVSRDAFVWKIGFPDWIMAGGSELQKYITAPPVQSQEKVSNVFLWLLAFAPFIGYFSESFIANLSASAGSNALHELQVLVWMQSRKFWYITLIVNIIFLTIDFNKLKKAGYAVGKIKNFVWLMPVYIYKRAQLTQMNMVPLIIWLVTFLMVFFF